MQCPDTNIAPFIVTTNQLQIEQKLGYQFHSKDLLGEALRHSSYVNEQPDSELRDNERFEFLGDAVLNLIVGHILMERYPLLKEGDLSRTRANLVNETHLAIMARSIDLGTGLQLGKGEIQTNGMEKNESYDRQQAKEVQDIDDDNSTKNHRHLKRLGLS